MKTSCIEHPANEPLIIIRQWQLDFCDGNTTAAALLSFFEYWHNIKLNSTQQSQKANDVAIAHGEQPTQDTNLYQWHTEEELIAGIMHTAKSPKTVATALNILVKKGVISIHRNPNPRYKFDKKRHFLFYPEVVNEWLKNRYGKNTVSSSKNTSRQSKNAERSDKNTSAITESSNETTEQIGVSPAGKAKNHQLPKLDDQQKDELLAFGIYGGGGYSHNEQPIKEPEYQARLDIESTWRQRIADDTKAALVLLLVAIRTKSPGFDPPADKSEQGAWGKGATDHLANYSLAELRRLYPKAVAHNSTHNLSYFKPQSLTDTLKRLKHGNFGENGNGSNGTYNTVTKSGAMRIT